MTEAMLIDANFEGCYFRSLSCRRAHFVGPVAFDRACFIGESDFEEAKFFAEAWFSGAEFNMHASFVKTTFHDRAYFPGVIFEHDAEFNKSVFLKEVSFYRAKFDVAARFPHVKFASVARFGGSVFYGDAIFLGSSPGKIQFNLGPKRTGRDQLCFVRTDNADRRYRKWPTGWSIISTIKLPDRKPEGEWGLLVRTSSEEVDVRTTHESPSATE
jgi:hypothetical protein